MSLLKLQNVSKYYQSETNVSMGIRNVSLEFNIGEFVAVTGSSGSGKSTLLNVISGLDGYDEGEFYINGTETSHFSILDWENYRGKNVGFIFQNYNIIESYTVLQNVMLALEVENYPRHDIKKRALELIDKVGLSSHKNKKTSRLSGGEKQRCVIARALAKDCPIIAADEPTGNLDSKTSEQVLSLLYEISKEKLVIIVTHNYDEVEKYATRKIKMNDGVVEEDKTIKTIAKEEKQISIDTANVMSFSNNTRFALRNIFATPKKFIFAMLVQFFVMFTIFSFYGSSMSTIRSFKNERVNTQQTEKRVLYKNKEGKIIEEGTISGAIKVFKDSSNFLDGQNMDTVVMVNNTKWYGITTKKRGSQSELSKKKQVLYERENDVILTTNFKEKINGQEITHLSITYKIDEQGYKYIEKVFRIRGYVDGESAIYFSDAFLESNTDIVSNTKGYQSIIFESSVAAERFVKKVNKVDNIVVYPYANHMPELKIQLFSITTYFVAMFIFLIIFLYFIIQVVSRSLMNSRKKDFGIYRSIGINKKTLGKTIVIEQVIISMITFIVTLIISYGLAKKYQYIDKIMQEIKLLDMVVLLIIFVLLAIRLALKFNKKIFNISVIDTLSESRTES